MMHNGLKEAQFLNTVERTFINRNIAHIIACLEEGPPLHEKHRYMDRGVRPIIAILQGESDG